ncbi:YheC/YheD family protein [Cohnella thermotolerans]|uniref:YheC/YheD family endospore coat-associated protein n=1 Tax=Cohnella thermotolerans TaxID=329858 RepID=UPI0004184DAA|nr:YheC/YheD family protein [Cohnella thermotolerans]
MPVLCPDSKPSSAVLAAFSSRRADREPPERLQALGIVVCERETSPPFAEASFIRRLIGAGRRYGLDVFAFSPATWSEERGTVRAWKWRSGWCREERPVPSVAYDRAWPENAAQRRRYRLGLGCMVQSRGLRLLNGSLPGKAEVHRALSRCPELGRWLPPTAVYRGEASLIDWLDRQGGAAFLKPSNGSQGRRVLSISRENPGSGLVSIGGRTAANRPFRLAGVREAEAIRRIHRWIGERPYVMQPLLELQAKDGTPFDLRVLMQRNGRGRWTTAGIAARCGASGSVTANLHGGGSPRRAEAYLEEQFGKRRAPELIDSLREAAFDIVFRLEESYGKFAELGLDFGVDRSGRIWFLEANAKPGRASMACAGGAAAAEAAERPLAYARYILLRTPGRVFHEFDSM